MASMDPLSFSAAVLNEMGIRPTPYTAAALMSLMQGEGQWGATGPWNAAADYNPFNISGGQAVLDQYGAAQGVGLRGTQNPGNGPPVDEFSDWQSGVKATADFLKNADPGITNGLQALAANPSQGAVSNFFNALQNSGSFGSSAGSRIQFFNNNLQQAQVAGANLASYTAPGGSINPNPTPGTPATGPASPNEGPSAPPVTTTPSTTTLQTGAGTPQLNYQNASQSQIKQYIQQNWPTYAWLLDDPQVAAVLDRAVKEGLDATQVQAAIAQTDWWKTTSSAMRQWQETVHTDPASAQKQAAAMTRQIQTTAANNGIKISLQQAEHLGTQAAEFQWTSDQITANIGALTAQGGGNAMNPQYLQYQLSNNKELQFTMNKDGTVNTKGGSWADQMYGQIADYTRSIGVKLPENAIKSLAQQSMMEGSGMQGWSTDQLASAVHQIIQTGQGQQASSAYLQGVFSNPGQYEFGNTSQPWQGVTTAAQYASVVRQTAISNGVQFTDKEIERLATEGMEQNWLGTQAGQYQMATAIGQAAKTHGVTVDPQTALAEIQNPREFQFQQSATPWLGTSTVDKNLNTLRQALAAAQVSGVSLRQMENYTKQGTAEGMFDPGNTAQLTSFVADIAKSHGVPNVDTAYLTTVLTNPEKVKLSGGANPYMGVSQADQALENVRFVASGIGLNVKDPKIEQELTQIVQEGLPKGWFDPSNPAATQQLAQALNSFADRNNTPVESPQYITDLLTQANQYAPPTANQANPQYGATTMDHALSYILSEAQSQGIKLTQDQMVALAESGFRNGWIDPGTGSPSGNMLAQRIGQLAGQQGLQAYNPQYLSQKALEPTQYRFSKNGDTTLADQTRMEVEVTAGQQGVNLSLAQAEEIATQALQFGWNTQQIQQAIGKVVNYGQRPEQQPSPISANAATSPAGQGTPMEPKEGIATNAQSLANQIQQTAASYLQSLNPQTLQQWMRGIAGGTQTTQQLQAYLAQQAEEKWPGMSQLIRQGLTPQQITNSLTNQTAQLLGVDPTQVNYINNPQYAKMLNGGYNEGPDGTKQPNSQMMTLQQADTYVRGLPQFQYTNQAKTDAGNVETAILQAFGRVG